MNREPSKLKLFKLYIAILFILWSTNTVAQEWKNLKSYQKHTNNKSLIEGSWLKKDRKRNTTVWKQANKYNLPLKNGSEKYKTIRQMRDFYLWFDMERKQQGHEIQWIGIAAIATNQLSKLEIGFYRLFFIRNKEVVQFALEGSEKVFSYAFPKLKEIYFSKQLFIGKKAALWDKDYGLNEQCLILNPMYAKLSKKAYRKLERMSKGKGIFSLAIPKKLKFEGELNDCKARVAYGKEKLLPIYLKQQQL